jgi:hypothetical protein
MDLGLSAPTYPSAKNVMLSDSSKHRASLKTKSSPVLPAEEAIIVLPYNKEENNADYR